jgi:hypothetical protein
MIAGWQHCRIAGPAVLVAALLCWTGCSRSGSLATATNLDAAAESYVRLVLALGERDGDSLDSYHGPPTWRAEAQRRHATLKDVRREAQALLDRLASTAFQDHDQEIRRTFLVRQLGAVVARVEILEGARPRFAEEARRLFALDAAGRAGPDEAANEIRAVIDRELPGHGTTVERLAAFDRRFVIAGDRLPTVMARAIEGCRAITRAHLELAQPERVDVSYARDSPWSAYTRYEGGSRSTIQINAALPLTVDRALDLACHEAYPGHHTINLLLEARLKGRSELLVQPTFSPQTALHESASSVAGMLAFTEAERIAFERDALFPLAGLDTAEAARHVRVSRLVDRLHGVEADVARRYLDDELDFPRASAALEHDALMPSADATLKFLNQFRSYAATYTIGRDLFWKTLEKTSTTSAAAMTKEDDLERRWRAYADLVANPSQALAPDR